MATYDFSKPLTESDLEGVMVTFRAMPTYTAEDGGAIPSRELPQLLKKIGYERTEEQVRLYVDYWNRQHGGKVPALVFVDLMRVLSDTAVASIKGAATYDKNGDGFIQRNEFNDFWNMLVAHEPKLEKIDFEQFVNEADANRDGMVSVEEFAIWITEKFPSLPL